jgi:hypothetical protein
LKKEMKDDTRRWKDPLMLIWQKQYCENGCTTNAVYRFNAISIKIPTAACWIWLKYFTCMYENILMNPVKKCKKYKGVWRGIRIKR